MMRIILTLLGAAVLFLGSGQQTKAEDYYRPGQTIVAHTVFCFAKEDVLKAMEMSRLPALDPATIKRRGLELFTKDRIGRSRCIHYRYLARVLDGDTADRIGNININHELKTMYAIEVMLIEPPDKPLVFMASERPVKK